MNPELDPELQPIIAESYSYYQQNQLEKAVNVLKVALEKHPQSPELLGAIADLYQLQEKLPQAIESYQQALSLNQNLPYLHYNLGNAYYKAQQVQAAIDSYQRALTLNPHYVQAHQNLGNLYVDLLQLEQAQKHFQQAQQGAPHNHQLKISSGQVHVIQGRYPEATQLFKEALALAPDNLEATIGLIKIQEETGNYQPAFQHLKRLITQGVSHLNVWTIFAQVCKQLKQSKDALPYLLNALKQSHWESEQISRLHFLIADTYDACEEYKQAWKHYVIANESKNYTYDIQPHIQLIDQIIHSFPQALKLNSSLLSNHLIFIVGMPRSGSTLLEQVLSNHPEVQGGGENPLLPQLLETHHLNGSLKHTQQEYNCLLDIGQTYLSAINSGLKRSKYSDKMLRNYLYLGIIAAIFPQAKIVHAQRHPLDTCLSIFFQDFSLGQRFAYNLEHIGQYYQQYQRLMAHWKRIQLPLFDVSYEELITHQLETSQNLIAHCQLNWSDDCLNHHQNQRHIMTASYQQVKQPIYKTSLARYKNYENYLQPLKKYV